jgi:hypothetical protein
LIFRKCVLILFATAIDLADQNLQRLANLDWSESDLEETQFRAKFKIMFDGYQGIFAQLLPDVIVQNALSMQGMTDLYMTDFFLQDRDRSELSYWNCRPDAG